MAVRAFVQPDHTTKTADQAGFEAYCGEIETAVAALDSGPLGQFAPFASAPPDMTVNVGAGALQSAFGLSSGAVPARVWTEVTLPASATWVSVTYGNGVFVAVASGSAIAATSTDGITWTQRTLPASATWVSVTYGDGVFVAVASGSAIAATSTDGITWTQRTLPVSSAWQCVTWGRGLFVAVSATSGTIAASSPDGVTWTQRTLSHSGNWWSVAYGSGKYVAVAYQNNYVSESKDGITWTQRLHGGTIYEARSVAFGNGLFVVVKESVANQWAETSPDGITWTSRQMPSAQPWKAVSFGGGLFVAVSSSGVAATSRNGINWSAWTLPMAAGAVVASRVGILALGASVAAYATGSDNTADSTALATLAAQQTATITAPATNPRIDRVGLDLLTGALRLLTGTEAASPVPPAYPDGVMPVCQVALAVGQPVITNAHLTDERTLPNQDSPQGLRVLHGPVPETFAEVTLPRSDAWVDVAFGEGGRVVALGPGGAGGGYVAVSTDYGATWAVNQGLAGASTTYCITYGAGLFVVGAAGAIYTSPDGVTWTARTAANGAWHIAWSGAVFAAVGVGSGTVAYSSSDGVTWTQRTLPSAQAWQSVAWGGGLFVAAASGATAAASSPDGVTWTARTMSTAGIAARGIAYGNGRFVAVGVSGTATAYSTNGTTWTAGAAPPSTGARAIVFANGVFVLLNSGTAGTATYLSADGLGWLTRTSAMASSLLYVAAAWGDGRLVAVAQASGQNPTNKLARLDATTTDIPASAYSNAVCYKILKAAGWYRLTAPPQGVSCRLTLLGAPGGFGGGYYDSGSVLRGGGGGPGAGAFLPNIEWQLEELEVLVGWNADGADSSPGVNNATAGLNGGPTIVTGLVSGITATCLGGTGGAAATSTPAGGAGGTGAAAPAAPFNVGFAGGNGTAGAAGASPAYGSPGPAGELSQLGAANAGVCIEW